MSTTDNSPMTNGLAQNILEQIPTPVLAVNREMEIIFMNKAGLSMLDTSWEQVCGRTCHTVFNSRHCNTPECRMRQELAGGESSTVRNELSLSRGTVPFEYTAAPLTDKDGHIIGGLEYILDISDRVKQEQRLREQSRTITETSTPSIKLCDRIIVLPVVGVVDSLRAQQMMSTMLEKIMETTSKVIILDIQGVAAVDTAVANHLIKIAKATKLMGCSCLISGISPAVAETLVELGIELGDVTTSSTLKDALADALAIMDLAVTEKA